MADRHRPDPRHVRHPLLRQASPFKGWLIAWLAMGFVMVYGTVLFILNATQGVVYYGTIEIAQIGSYVLEWGVGRRRPLDHDVLPRRRRRLPRLHLRQGLHGGRRPLHVVLRVVLALRRRHARPRRRPEPHPADRRLGARRRRLVPADRALLGGLRERRCGQQGVHGQQGRRRGLFLGAIIMAVSVGSFDFNDVIDVVVDGEAGRSVASTRSGRGCCVHRCDGQVGAVPAPRVVARCHGRPDPGVGPHARRNHGHGRCLPARSPVPLLPRPRTRCSAAMCGTSSS